jgi:hypothetical protein
MNVTLKPTPGITSGYVMVVIISLPDQASLVTFNQEWATGVTPKGATIRFPFNATVVYSQSFAAPILSSTPVTTPNPPTLYGGLVIGTSVLGNLTDIIPITGDILNTTLTGDSDQCGSSAPYTMTFP